MTPNAKRTEVNIALNDSRNDLLRTQDGRCQEREEMVDKKLYIIRVVRNSITETADRLTDTPLGLLMVDGRNIWARLEVPGLHIHSKQSIVDLVDPLKLQCPSTKCSLPGIYNIAG